MGGVSCCDNPEKKHQIVIDQMTTEDRLRTQNSKRRFMINSGYDIRKIKFLQATTKAFLTRKKFYKYYDIMKKITIDELKGCIIADKNLGELLNGEIRNLENSENFEKYEKTEFYIKNINKWNNNNFVIKFPALYVDRVHHSDIYEGMWNIDKKFHGYGILIKTDGSKYQGFWEGGHLNGFGRFYTQTGDYYEGNFVKGVACGYGVFIHKDGTLYRGEWQNDQPHGKGKEYFPDGSFFDGTFYNGKKNGQGHFTWTDGSTYTGNIQNEIFEGFGKYNWADGRIYEGTWKNNQMHGNGLLIYPDGTFYEGEFFNNLRHGQGKYQWSDTKYYEGTWNWGNQHGKGFYFKKGQLIEGIWNNGKLQNHKVISKNQIDLSQFNGRDNKSSIISTSHENNTQGKKEKTNTVTPNTNILISTKTKSLKKFTTPN